jgi:FAD/FMN-containing dehydrogenase
MGRTFTELSTICQGEVITPGDPRYEQTRQVWNGSIQRRPAAILRCAGVADVRAGIRYARDNGLLLAVRAGGHNIAGLGTCDDGLVLDLRAMRGIRVDPTRRSRRRCTASPCW